jgi:hypothetical protein
VIRVVNLRIARAWFVVHRGSGLVLGLVGCGGFFAVLAHHFLPSFGAHPLVPLWSLTPGTLAMVCAVGVENRLVDLGTASARVVRLLWLGAVVLLAALAASPVAHIEQQRAIATAAAALATVTFAVASVVGRLALVVGLAVDIAAVTWVSAPTDRFGYYLDHIPAAGLALGAASTVGGAAAYVVRGAHSFAFLTRDDLD